MAYPDGNLTTRAVIKPGKFALIPPEGRVINSVPGFEDCEITILGSPDIGMGFAQYIMTVKPGGRTTKPFASEENIQAFAYTVDGSGKVKIANEEEKLTEGGFAYSPPDKSMELVNDTDEDWRLFVHKQKYRPLKGHSPYAVFGNANEIEGEIYEDMENVFLKTFLPDEMGFDVNFHILIFEPDGSHPFIETHIQEHGLYMLGGQGMYLLDDEWIPVEKEDYIWFGPYTPQAFYCTGRENTYYVYTKDNNRDVELS